MAVNYAELAKRLQATPADAQTTGVNTVSGSDLTTQYLEQKYGGGSVSSLETATPTPIQTGAPEKPGGFFTGVARAVAPLGDAIGSALGTFGAKKMEADTAKRQEELSNVAISLIRNKNLSADQKARALKALQISQDTGVIAQSGAFNTTGLQVAGQALGTLGSVVAGGGSALASRLGLKGAAGIAARALGEGVVGGTTFGLGGGLQSENPSTGGELAASTLKGALVSGGIGLAGEAAGAILKYASQTIPGKMINGILKTRSADFNFGKNPGEAVVNEGITANSRGGFLRAISDRKEQIGKQIGELISRPENAGKIINVRDLLSPIKEAKAGALASGDTGLYKSLQSLEDGLTNKFKIQQGEMIDLAPSPKERMDMRRQLRQQPITERIQTDKIRAQIAKQANDEAQREAKFVEQIKKAEQLKSPKRSLGYDIQQTEALQREANKQITAAKEAIQVNKEAGVNARETLRAKLQQVTSEGEKTRSQLNKKLDLKFGKRNLELSLGDAQDLKQEIGNSTKWNGLPYDSSLNQVRVKLYGNLKRAISDSAPGLSGLNDRYANLLTAEKSLEKAIVTADRNNVLPIREVILAAGNHPVGAAALYATKSTAAQTRIAQALSKLRGSGPAGTSQTVVEVLKKLATSSLQNTINTN